MTTEQKIIKNKLGLLRLAEMIGNVASWRRSYGLKAFAIHTGQLRHLRQA